MPPPSLMDLLQQYEAEDRELAETAVPEPPERSKDRGLIFNLARATQPRDFSGLRFGTITPTDLDGFIDFRDKLFVIIETKVRGQTLGRGQELALERLCDATHIEGRREALVVVAEHETPVQVAIDVGAALVIRYRYRAKWFQLNGGALTTRGFIDRFLAHLAKRNKLQ